MSPGSWEDVKRIFEQGCDRTPVERTAWLARLDLAPNVRLEVERLFQLHDAAGADFLEEPPAGVTALRRARAGRLREGELLAGRYAVVRFLGGGGMGEVYEVEDRGAEDSARARLAIKLLNEDLAQDPAYVRRFSREVRLARQVSHTNVCRVFGLEQHAAESGDLYFLTMELLSGNTLAGLLESGPLASAEARQVADQMLAGLMAAHAAGIVHRDLKPSNIMVVPQPGGGRVVLTDFGLAMQPQAVESAITGSGGVLGTLDYMAPEQLRGEEVSFRTDLYAVGLILYELVSGSRPFAATSGIGTVANRLSRDAPDLRKVAPSVPRCWADTVAACLARDPRQRPASAAAVARLLQSPSRARAARLRARVSRRAWIASAAAGVTGMSLIPLARRFYLQKGMASGVNSLLLADMRNATGNSQFDGIAALMRAQLAQSTQFELVSEDRARQLLVQMQRPGDRLEGSVAREVALRHGAQVVAGGTLRRSSSGYALDLRLEQLGSKPDDVAHWWERTFTAAGPVDLMAAVRAGAEWMRQRAGEADVEIARQSHPPEDLTTSHWEAVSAYSLGQRRRLDGRLDEAATLFREAIAQDPDFAAAHEWLADVLVSEHRYAEGYEAWVRAIAVLKKRNLTTRERYRGEGGFYYDVFDWRQSAAAFTAWVAHYPNDFDARFQLASALAYLGRYDEAIEQFREALRLSPYYGSRHRLIRLYMQRNDRARAMEQMDALRRSGPPSAVAYNDAWFAFLDGHVAESLDHLGRLARLDADEWTASASYFQACVLAEGGDVDTALAILQSRISAGVRASSRPSAAEHCVGVAALLHRMGEGRKASEWARAALIRDPGPRIVAAAGSLLARAGAVDDAVSAARLLDAAPSLPVFDIARERCRGEIELARGNLASAIAHLERAAAMGAPTMLADYLSAAYVKAGQERKAARLYEQWLSSPAWIWRTPEAERPGVLSEIVAGASKIAATAPVAALQPVLDTMPFLAPARAAGPRPIQH